MTDVLDWLITEIDKGLKTVSVQASPSRPYPGSEPPDLSPSERRLSEALMRVDHVGEVCAQGLYSGQSAVARDKQTRDMLRKASQEEEDHLAWCEQRLKELGGRTSYLNPLWYTGSWVIGAVAGSLSDRLSLGFVVETERQVEAHISDHLNRLPQSDTSSRAILEQMRMDEAEHADHAQDAGGQALSQPVKIFMKCLSSVMTGISYYL